MTKFAKVLVAAMLILGFGASTLSADCTQSRDTAKGKKYFQKKFKKSIFDGATGAKVAGMFSEDEWDELFEDNAAGFIKEFGAGDKKAKIEKLFEKEAVKNYLNSFLKCYANDSGNVPSC